MENVLLPHHEQQPLCTTRLPYRQGRKLTAVKAYSITKESNHLLIFGVPSLNLRQETKSLFLKFGRLLQFTISLDHPAESFTETYHAQYDKVQSARVAKKMLDTKNFYGGCLHVCYAPELENISETKEKLLQRQRDVLYRLKNLDKEVVKKNIREDVTVVKETTVKVNMAEENIIYYGNKKRRKVGSKKSDTSYSISMNYDIPNNKTKIISSHSQPPVNFIGPLNKGRLNEVALNSNNSKNIGNNLNKIENKNEENIEIVDCTSVHNETITNINEHLNYKKFGTEIVKKIPVKPVNKIKFNINI
ncbi:RNA-binding protein 48 [Pieris rapae]|uniref:RNA-binding protein 48 n=1 Tax=Pieris rapae TaxID=64459 RepID=UPI001E279F65|nr:RNA-binding protein 48 [Pieris rapae]